MGTRVLFVDDEVAILDGYKRLLHREFDVDIAAGGPAGLAAIQGREAYAVVISDMRMPGMSGAQFLAEVRRVSPMSVRMLLTGYTDMNAAIEAVNEGNIFRFLTKPCDKDILVNAINAGAEQYRLLTAERELLEKTVLGSIKTLSEVLNAASPEAFSRSLRVTRYVRQVVERLNLESRWRFEAAAMLSQLGCVTLDPDLIKASYVGEKLSVEEKTRFDAHPKAAETLLSHIPRLEPIVWMIGQQLKSSRCEPSSLPAGYSIDCITGAEVLRTAVAFDNWRMRGLSHDQAIARLRDHKDQYRLEIVNALSETAGQSGNSELRKVSMSKLMTGMVLQQEIRTSAGMLVVPKGQEITQALLLKLDNFSQAGMIAKEVMVLVPA